MKSTAVVASIAEQVIAGFFVVDRHVIAAR